GRLARREPPEVPLQDATGRQAPRAPRAARGLRRDETAALQRLLGAVAARQLSGRDPHGARADALPRISRGPRAMALSPLLRGAPRPARARRRPAVRGEVRRAVAGVLPEGPLSHHPRRVLTGRVPGDPLDRAERDGLRRRASLASTC